MKRSPKSKALVKAQVVAPVTSSAPAINRLYQRVCEILATSRQRVARTVNTEMVHAYWLIGQAIVEQEQKGKKRAGYGEHLIEGLSARMRADGQKGFHPRNLWWMRDFFLKFPILNAVRSELSWTHDRLLLKVENDEARAFYETEAAASHWGTRELERQINSFYFERTALSKQKRQMLERGRTKAKSMRRRISSKTRWCSSSCNCATFPNSPKRTSKLRSSITCKSFCSNSAKASASSRANNASRLTAIIFTWIWSYTTGCCAVLCCGI
jgi:predicted nuclease of restriction endonuclease-like (RecB) superfamily